MNRIVEIEWEDAAAKHGWGTAPPAPKDTACYSVGYVTEDTEQGIILAFQRAEDWDGDSIVGCMSFIPRSAIRKVRELK